MKQKLIREIELTAFIVYLYKDKTVIKEKGEGRIITLKTPDSLHLFISYLTSKNEISIIEGICRHISSHIGLIRLPNYFDDYSKFLKEYIDKSIENQKQEEISKDDDDKILEEQKKLYEATEIISKSKK